MVPLGVKKRADVVPNDDDDDDEDDEDERLLDSGGNNSLLFELLPKDNGVAALFSASGSNLLRFEFAMQKDKQKHISTANHHRRYTKSSFTIKLR